MVFKKNKRKPGVKNNIIQEEVVEKPEEQILRKKQYKNTAGKAVMRMNLTTDQQGNIYFNDVLFGFIKRSYMKIYNKNLTLKGTEIIKKAEEVTNKKIRQLNKR